MPLTRSGKTPFAAFDSRASFGMGEVIDYWSRSSGIGMDDEGFEVHVAVGPASSASAYRVSSLLRPLLLDWAIYPVHWACLWMGVGEAQ